MRDFRWALLAIGALLGSLGDVPLHAGTRITLGPADELALDQPRVAIELIDPTTGRSLGPNLANTFLLDTGANSILAVDDSVYELNLNGYQTEGTFLEQGVGGFTEFDVSAKYDIHFAGSDGIEQVIPDGRMLSSTTASFCPIPGLCSFFGILGMPAMENRVTTLDLTSLLGDGGSFSIDDIFAGNFDVGFLDTRFSPATSRYEPSTLPRPARGGALSGGRRRSAAQLERPAVPARSPPNMQVSPCPAISCSTPARS